MQIAAAGDRALLVTLPGASSARLRAAAESVRRIAGVIAAIVGHESLYVIGTDDVDAIRRAVAQSDVVPESTISRHIVPVSFHQEHALDLRDFLAHVAVSREAFLSRLESISLSVRYLGFRAGFSYLDGWPPEWSKPRRSTSRNQVPGGSFGIAGSMAGFYAVDSPGSWNILGRTAARLWDPQREPPNLFAPGDAIALVPSEAREPLRKDEAGPSPSPRLGTSIAEVIAPGQLTTIVGPADFPRLEYGLAAGGPFDEEAAAIANAAVGNDAGVPLLECVLVGPKLRFPARRRVAWCDGELHVRIHEGREVDVGRIRGMRAWVAIEGGIDEMRLRYAEAPTVLKRGDSLFAPLIRPFAPLRATFSPPAGRRDSRLTIRIMRGPHDAPPLPEEWEVTPQLDRVGIRWRSLQELDVKLPTDLPSCGAQFGTLQWHADGSIVALGPDHPVTGGYLQPATVISADRWKLGQLAPGDRLRLVAV